MGLLQTGIDRFPNEPALTKALAATQAAFSAKRREEAIERLCADARAQQGKHRFEEGRKAIDDGLAEYGRDRRLTEIRDQIVAAKAEWERSEAIRQRARRVPASTCSERFRPSDWGGRIGAETVPGRS